MKDILKELKIFMPAIIVIAIVSSAVTTTANAVDIGTINTVKVADKTEKEEDAPVPEVDIKKDALDSDAASAENISVAKDTSLDGQKYKDGVYTGVGKGFNGNIHVEVTIKDGEISEIKITQHSDDQPYINNAMALINNIIQTQSIAVDTVSGATYSSRGIIDAVKDALSKAIDSADSSQDASDDTDAAEDSSSDNSDDDADTSETSKDTSLDGQKFKDGTYTGVSKGFNGNIYVKVTIKDGMISKIKVTQHSDDQPYMNNATALIDNIVKTQSIAVDTVSGATYSSKGIISAVKNALNKALLTSDPSLDETEDSADTNTDSETETDTDQSDEEDNNYEIVYGNYADGTYIGKARGYKSIFTATVVITNGSIVSIDIEQADDEAYYLKCVGIMQLIITHQTTEGIDTVSGCTSSSNGILNSVKAALAKAALPEEAEETEE